MQLDDDFEKKLKSLNDRVLTISDRRITLDGLIIGGMAAYVNERIHLYNNPSTEYPIFIVINSCPNAILLYNQPSGFSYSNLTDRKEQLDVFKKWVERLHKPVVDKMGISLEEFYKKCMKRIPRVTGKNSLMMLQN